MSASPPERRRHRTSAKPVVRVAHPTYQPSKAEREEEVPLDASFEDLVKAAVRPVEVRYVNPGRKKP